MHFQQPSSAGSADAVPDKKQQSSSSSSFSSSSASFYRSSTLPFGQDVALSFVGGPTYLTAQTLVQQVAYTLSDKVFTYSPDTFDLDLSLKKWHADSEKNVHGYVTGLSSLQTRSGAGSIALGYMFSKDFDLSKRHIPQTIVASSAALAYLRPSLDQLSLLYSVANPVVTQLAAADYAVQSSSGLITDYVAPMAMAEELGLGLIASTSNFEAQHMSLLATLLSTNMPTTHVYDGINVGRETNQIVDVLDGKALNKAYQAISAAVSGSAHKHSDNQGKTSRLLQAFNEELGTDYKPFEIYGHNEPEHVLVVFGSVEGSLAAQLAFALNNQGSKVAAVNVRVYRPFLEDTFLDVLPSSVRTISVLGQVKDTAAASDAAEHSRLYADVLATVAFSTKFANVPLVVDLKYAREVVWTPRRMLSVLEQIQQTSKSSAEQIPSAPVDDSALDLLGPAVKRYSFWDVDDSTAVHAPTAIAQLLSRESTENVQLRTGYDNLTRGGVVRSDIRCHAKSIEAPYSITGSNASFVGDEKLLIDFDILNSVREGGQVVIKLPGAKEQDTEKLEKRLPESFRKALSAKRISLFILDPMASPKVVENPHLESVLLPIAFLRLTRENFVESITQLAPNHDSEELLKSLSEELDKTFWSLEIPETWSSVDIDVKSHASRHDINANAFTGHEKVQNEVPSFLRHPLSVAQGLAFKEATGTRAALRPDLAVTTYTVHVQERRRLTPATYDRNIFHIEFDLGTSGLKYAIGEALGIHQENDEDEVNEFIAWYGLNASDIVEVPSREDPDVLESRTVYQALMQNIDIFGRPPKRFYEMLSEFATSEKEKKDLLALGGTEAAVEFKRRAEVDTVTYVDLLREFGSAKPAFHDLVRLVAPLKRREYSIASSQRVTPTSVSLLIVTVNWVDPSGRDRFGQATRYLNALRVGAPVTVSVKPSVMKLPPKSTAPLIMAGLGTGLAPFRAFVQERAWQKQHGEEIGEVMLYMGSRHQREEYLYGEEWEAYRDAGIITHMGCAFSRDQPQKIYIQDRMRETLPGIRDAYLRKEGSFYLCGPTWPVPDVTEVLEEAVVAEGKAAGQKKVDGRRAIEQLKDDARYVLEVY